MSEHRKTELSKATDGQLKAYSSAAIAAGISALALAQPAEGKVIVTQTNIQIDRYGSATIDLNNDGIKDFSFFNGGGDYDHSFYGTFAVRPLTGGKVVAGVRGSQGAYASVLAQGAVVGPSAKFSSSAGRGQALIERSTGDASATVSNSPIGPWTNISTKYLGVKFLISGETHYGWIQMSTDTNKSISATITAYAYETVPNKKVMIEPSGDEGDAAAATMSHRGPALGMLAMGADGLKMWRQ
jgi:hypothetical protein